MGHPHADQQLYYDRVVKTWQTRKGSGQLVKWKDDYWTYYNHQLIASSIDEHVWREAYVQPLMQFLRDDANVLLIGNEGGLLLKELNKNQYKIIGAPI